MGTDRQSRGLHVCAFILFLPTAHFLRLQSTIHCVYEAKARGVRALSNAPADRSCAQVGGRLASMARIARLVA